MRKIATNGFCMDFLKYLLAFSEALAATSDALICGSISREKWKAIIAGNRFIYQCSVC